MIFKLSERRRKASVEIERQILQSLVPLGIPHARFNIEFKSKELADNGIDKVQYLFSANSSSPLSRTAGETGLWKSDSGSHSQVSRMPGLISRPRWPPRISSRSEMMRTMSGRISFRQYG